MTPTNAYRPLQIEYSTVGRVLRYFAQDFYIISEDQFINFCMKYSHGAMNPDRARGIYRDLMEEAGLLK